ncbi:MAG: hypothetical protein B1H13_13255 [Desulfobacteraceae bacterium 4484_190.3]|nr:MAG: hypothetical protein B1H13_13255 [Desulfobacteraceae bacterium 4484_190.3]
MYDGILNCFTLLSQPMVFLKAFFHSPHNPAGRRTVAAACLRLPVPPARQTGADTHRQARRQGMRKK